MIRQNTDDLKTKKNEEKLQQITKLKEIDQEIAENNALIKVYRSLLKVYLHPFKDMKLKGIIKGTSKDCEFEIDVKAIKPNDLHDTLWGLIAKNT